LKRRWPLSKVVVVGPEPVCNALKRAEELFLELANVKNAQYTSEAPQLVASEGWASASEGEVQVFLDARRDEKLLGEGVMRDLARRVQALRKELGYMPTDVLEAVYLSELDDESIRLLHPFVDEMKGLVRAEKVLLQGSNKERNVEWHESQLDDRKVAIAILGEKKK
jgi:isoleucyl-tRNA synthetase